MNETELKCTHCNRYIGTAVSIIGTLKCPSSSCKGETQFKIVEMDVSKAMHYKFKEAPKPPKKKETTE